MKWRHSTSFFFLLLPASTKSKAADELNVILVTSLNHQNFCQCITLTDTLWFVVSLTPIILQGCHYIHACKGIVRLHPPSISFVFSLHPSPCCTISCLRTVDLSVLLPDLSCCPAFYVTSVVTASSSFISVANCLCRLLTPVFPSPRSYIGGRLGCVDDTQDGSCKTREELALDPFLSLEATAVIKADFLSADQLGGVGQGGRYTWQHW